MDIHTGFVGVTAEQLVDAHNRWQQVLEQHHAQVRRQLVIHSGREIDAAGPGEILVSGTVKDLVAGSGIQFLERDVVELRGVPGLWPLFRVDPLRL